MYDAIHAAPLGTSASSGTVRSVPDTHRMALPSEGEADRLMDVVLRFAREICEQKGRFEEQIAASRHIALPRLTDDLSVDMRLYDRLVDSVDPSQHDVPFLLFCMCEQVGHSLQGDVVDREEDHPDIASGDAEEQALLGLLAEAHNRVGGDLVSAGAGELESPEHASLAELETFLGEVTQAFRGVEGSLTQLRSRRGEDVVVTISKIRSLIVSARAELAAVVTQLTDENARAIISDAVRKSAEAEDCTRRAADANAALSTSSAADLPRLREEAQDTLGELELAVESVSAAVAGAKDYCVMRRVSFPREDEAARQAAFAATAQASGRAALAATETEMAVVLPHLDYAACRHYGRKLPGDVAMLDEIHRLLAHLEAPGVRRAGFPPENAVQPKAVRTAICNRIYDFMPHTPIVEIERLLLLHEFEKMLCEAQPERSWNLRDRVYHERIPGSLFVQTLMQATQSGFFVETAYMKRHDCLLIALHHRVPAGCLLWHNWDAPTHFRPTPTYNDWSQQAPISASSNAKGSTATVPTVDTLLDIDGREMGYCKVLEKIHLPADGSVIVRSSLQRGQREMFPRPERGKDITDDSSPSSAAQQPLDSAGADQKDEGNKGGERSNAAKLLDEAKVVSLVDPYFAPPSHELRCTQINKDGLSFSVVSDESWSEVTSELRSARLEKERLEAEAAAALEAERAEAEAARVAQGLPPDDTDAGGEESAAGGEGDHERRASVDAGSALGVTCRRIEDLKYGILRMSFEGGARCSVRMHHERRWYADGDTTYDTTVARPGVVFTYSPVSGVIVQVFSDGAARVLWPRQLLGGRFGGGASASSGVPNRPPLPGCSDDMEISRVITPFGTLFCERLSGRKEFYYPNGLRAVRNPTKQEVERQLERLDRNGYGDSALGWLRRLYESLEDEQLTPGSAPTVDDKAAGLPGHWRIIRPDGRTFGRARVPERSLTENAVQGDGDADGDVGAPDDAEPPAEVPPLEASPSPLAVLQEVLDGWATDGGATVEYEVEQPVIPSLMDPHTGQLIDLESDGLLRWADSDGSVVTSILPDGTRVFRRRRPEGSETVFEKERAPRITCTINDRTAHHRCIFMDVECDDGTRLRVTPQCLNLVGDLAPADPTAGYSESFSTNAAVTVHRREGAVVSSKGSGEVDIISSYAMGGGSMGSTLDRGQVYTAYLDEDKISIRDRDGNQFDAHGDQTVQVKLAVSMGDDFQSPRCREPGKAYKHPHAEFLPVPERAPDPRLFVVYGDGDAEELLLTRDALEVLRLAEADADTLVLQERMGPPMEVCRCHTLQRAATADQASGRLEPLALPPIVNGTSAAALANPTAGGMGGFTQFRQLVEYPSVDDSKHRAFLTALERLEELERTHRALSQKPGGAAVADAMPKLRPPAPDLAAGGGGA
eukprot:TRINITY_DN16425_c0_g2_i1.p1 TRINITY_DN16425_c0_g2~~TRINITY_DN16425_c0_g2_i1.p1  ORF type:complete len:1634 (+),score=303.63 TRINITY_DN16425_c0_g2_i1:693-4904(+)